MAQDPVATRPDDYPIIALDFPERRADLPLEGRLSGGYADGDVFTARDANALHYASGMFDKLSDEREVAVPEVFSTTSAFRLTSDQLAYEVSAGLVAVKPTTTPTYVLVGGVRLELAGARMDRLGLAAVNFTPNKETWIYAGLTTVAGVVVVDVQFDEKAGPAAPPTPPANYSALVRVVTDATDVTANEYVSAPSYQVVVDALTWVVSQLQVTTLTAASLDTDAITTKRVTVANVASMVVGLDVTGAGDTFASKIVGGNFTALQASNASASTCMVVTNTGTGRAAFVQNSDASQCALRVENLGAGCAIEAVNAGAGPTATVENTGTGAAMTATNDDASSVTLTTTNNNASGSALAIAGNASLAASKTLTLGASAQITGPSTAGVTAGTISTIDASGIVAVGEARFFTDATPSSSTGVVQFDGRALNVGEGGVARRVASPAESHVVGPINTAAGIADTGAQVTIFVENGETVKIVYAGEFFSDAVGDTVNIRIEVAAVTIGGGSFVHINTASVYVLTTKTVQYTGTGASVTIKARYGVSGAGTQTDGRNINLSVTRT